ncbi:hypothetical protein CRUP_015264, partial [Coryphaenoides rupestris]
MKEQEGVRLQLQRSQREQEMQMNKHKVAREEWECERAAMQREISQLTKNLGCNSDKLRTMEGKHKVDVKETGASLSSELSRLRSEREEGKQRIRALEEDVRVLSASNVETDAVLGRMKERVKKMCDQIKHEEEKRKSAQEDQDKLQQLSLEVQSTEEWLRDERLERERTERASEGLRTSRMHRIPNVRVESCRVRPQENETRERKVLK